jgi:hypothetical protein
MSSGPCATSQESSRPMIMPVSRRGSAAFLSTSPGPQLGGPEESALLGGAVRSQEGVRVGPARYDHEAAKATIHDLLRVVAAPKGATGILRGRAIRVGRPKYGAFSRSPSRKDETDTRRDQSLTIAEQVKLEIPFSLVVTTQPWHCRCTVRAANRSSNAKRASSSWSRSLPGARRTRITRTRASSGSSRYARVASQIPK